VVEWGYYDGTTWRYIETNPASNYYQDNGEHVWRTAVNGSAGVPTTFSERMRIDNGGDISFRDTSANEAFYWDASASSLGIGTTSPDTITEIAGDNPILTIRDTDTSSSTATATIRFAESGAGGTLGNYWDVGYSPVNLLNFDYMGSTKMTINSAGNVGIGETSPSYIFEVKNSGTSRYVSHFLASDGVSLGGMYEDASTNGEFYVKDGSGNTQIKLDSAGDTFFTGGDVGIGTASPATNLHISSAVSTPTARIESTHPSGIPFLDLKGAASSQIRYIDETGTIQTRMDMLDGGGFSFVDVAGSGSTRMLINSSGNVGIGTTSPSGKLHISPDANSNYVFTGSSTSGYITTFNMNDTGAYIGHNSSSRTLNFQTNSADRLTILGQGLVGIGTTSPTQKLHVAGNARVTGAYYDSSNSSGTSGQLLSSTGSATDWIDVPPAPSTDNQNGGSPLKYWSGTQTQYDALTPDANTIYFIT
jgi:hypothetical protein